MKRFRLMLIVFIIAGSFINIEAQRRINTYKIKKAIVTYKYTGMSEGVETLYFDNYGKKEARYSELVTKAFGFTNKTKELNLHLDSVNYNINLLTNTGIKQSMPGDFSGRNMAGMEEWKGIGSGEEMMDAMGFEKTGEEMILGKKCEIWEGMGTKTWTWNNISLKSIVNIMGEMTIEATEIDLNTSIPASKFKIPEGINFDELDYENEDDLSPEEMQKQLKEGLNQLKGLMKIKKK